MSTKRKEILSALLSALITVRDVPKYRSVAGICFGVRRVIVCNPENYPKDVLKPALEEMEYLFMDWDKYSGDRTYPVPSPVHLNSPRREKAEAASYYFNLILREDEQEFWIGSYGALRWELLHFLIARVTALYESEQEDITS